MWLISVGVWVLFRVEWLLLRAGFVFEFQVDAAVVVEKFGLMKKV